MVMFATEELQGFSSRVLESRIDLGNTWTSNASGPGMVTPSEPETSGTRLTASNNALTSRI